MRRLVGVVMAAVVVAGCGGGPILANPPLDYPSPVAPTTPPDAPNDPIPVELPRDDGPHGRLTEWWYYTGHLESEIGRRFGFEAVVFRAERGSVPPSWAAHLALTDEGGRRFSYAQRSEIGPQVDHSPRDAAGDPTGFDLQVAGLNPELIAGGAAPFAPPWRLAGSNGVDTIQATLTDEEAAAADRSFGLDLALTSTKPAALHGGDRVRRLRAGGLVLLLLPDAARRVRRADARRRDVCGHGHRLVRPPVGRLHLGRRRLGLVRDQPRRRHGSHAVGRSRRGRGAGPRLRDARRVGRDVAPPRARTPSTSAPSTRGRAR